MTQTIHKDPDIYFFEREPHIHLSYVAKTKEMFLNYANKYDVEPENIALRGLVLQNIRDELDENEDIVVNKRRSMFVRFISNPYDQPQPAYPENKPQPVYSEKEIKEEILILTFKGNARRNIIDLSVGNRVSPNTVGRNALKLFHFCENLKPKENLVIFNKKNKTIKEKIDHRTILSTDSDYF